MPSIQDHMYGHTRALRHAFDAGEGGKLRKHFEKELHAALKNCGVTNVNKALASMMARYDAGDVDGVMTIFAQAVK